jgi:outer membrane receptor for ferrienterochelin and colicin
LVDAPVSISAIGGQTLQDQADVNFSDYLDTVPGLEVSSNREGSAVAT